MQLLQYSTHKICFRRRETFYTTDQVDLLLPLENPLSCAVDSTGRSQVRVPPSWGPSAGECEGCLCAHGRKTATRSQHLLWHQEGGRRHHISSGTRLSFPGTRGIWHGPRGQEGCDEDRLQGPVPAKAGSPKCVRREGKEPQLTLCPDRGWNLSRDSPDLLANPWACRWPWYRLQAQGHSRSRCHTAHALKDSPH